MAISGGTAILWRPFLATSAPSITLVPGRAQATPFTFAGMGQVWVYTTGYPAGWGLSMGLVFTSFPPGVWSLCLRRLRLLAPVFFV